MRSGSRTGCRSSPAYRKPDVQGVTATAIDVVVEAGDSGPITPIGVNLPNDQRIREAYGSKSVSLSNVTEAYENSTTDEFRHEFTWDDAEFARAKRWGASQASWRRRSTRCSATAPAAWPRASPRSRRSC